MARAAAIYPKGAVRVTLFDPIEPTPGGVHTGDPKTSHEAAHKPSNMMRWGTQRHQLLLAFSGRSGGLTADRAGELAGVGEYNQRRRCSELIAGGLLEDSGAVSDGQRILRITSQGEAALRAVKRPTSVARGYDGEPLKDSP